MARPEGLPRGDELDTFVQRMLNDTGFYCRNVMGFHTDSMPELPQSEPGKGGVRSTGNHQKVVSLLDDFSRPLAVIQCPRNAYKSSIVAGYFARNILRHPDFRGLLVMHDMKKAAERVQVVRDHLESNEIVRFLFGSVRGPLWKQQEFVTNLRSRRRSKDKGQGLLDPTLAAAAVGGALPTGAHPDVILYDDIVHRDNIKTPEMVASIIEDVRYFNKLRGGMGVVRDVGTPYLETDAHAFLLSQSHWERLILPIGFKVAQHDDGGYYLDGPGDTDPEWPHLSKKFLTQQLGDGFMNFMSQYALQVVGGDHQAFHRGQFTPVSWRAEMETYSGYLLTDIATSDKTEGCLNVLMYVGLDPRRRVTILDCEIGRWGVHEFCDRLLKMQERWRPRLCHVGVCFEQTSAFNAYKSILESKARDQDLRIHLLLQPRNSSEMSKSQRILSLEPRFQAREVFVCDTVPTKWLDTNRLRTLWSPDGYEDPTTGQRYPDGELVVQFTRYPTYRLQDIPDTLAMIDYYDRRTGQVQCFYKKPASQHLAETITRKPVGRGNAPGWGTAKGFYQRATRRIGG